jgi:Glycosyl transferase family 90
MALIGLKRRWALLVTTIIAFILFAHVLLVNDGDIRKSIKSVPLPGKSNHETVETAGFLGEYVPQDKHPISQLMAEADHRWRRYEESRSRTFRECVATYRRKYGRHPPPMFDEWYKFARARHAHNVDDFEQVMDDLRPFWAIQPRILRRLSAHMWEVGDGIAGIHIRDHKVVGIDNSFWRADTFVTMLNNFLKYLPDMDIPLNRMDQPRVVVPWDDMQALLAKEQSTRGLPPQVINEFTEDMTDIYDMTLGKDDGVEREDPGWYNWAGKQYMEVVRTACPPESHANRGVDVTTAESTWKDRLGGIVSNFNLSSDLCTIGPEIQDMHGFLFSSATISATKRLVPVFGECKINVNSDILFPANMYWKDDERYNYDDSRDKNWDEKEETVVWRGVTSGGVQLEDNWQKMHRQRLVRMMNGTFMDGKEVRVVTEQPEGRGDFENYRQFKPTELLEQHSDVGFTETWGCIPNCDFYKEIWKLLPQIPLPAQFLYKFLVDVDGHSFSGRWRAFLQSKSLGIKATIFREWHDSRLFAWRHFVPMDNRYDDIFTILTYFMGTGDPEHPVASEAFVPRHDLEAKWIALQGREWANKVLRNEDIEVFAYR